jgi:hypothetical protein
VFITLIALYVWRGREDRRVLLDLPEHERRALYGRTLQTLRDVCRGPPDGELGAFCRGQAAFIVNLPECDASCETLARAQLQRPTR